MARFATALFCDDIRQEEGSKTSYMGVYGAEILIPSTPFLLPKFCFVVSVSTDPEDPFQQMIVKLTFNERVDEFNIDSNELKRLTEEQLRLTSVTNEDPDIERVSRFGIRGVISPYVIEREGIFKLRVQTESGILRAGTLIVRVGPQQKEAAKIAAGGAKEKSAEPKSASRKKRAKT